jgi:hypothetical protein
MVLADVEVADRLLDVVAIPPLHHLPLDHHVLDLMLA